jgi:lysophospholipase L1-like esterase
LAAAACSSTPTSPTQALDPGRGPVLSQGPLGNLIPQEPPPVPPRISSSPVTQLGATRFVSFGDSITAGTLSSFDGAFLYDVPTHSYSERLRLALNTYHGGPAGQIPRTYTVINQGVPGEWALHGAARIQNVINQDRPQGLLLLEGINDLSNTANISATINALTQIVNTARANNVTVLIATMPQTYESTNPFTGETRTNAKDLVVPFNSQIRALVQSRPNQNIYLVDLYTAFGNNPLYMGGDGLHPTEAGYERMASTFLNVIEAAFVIRGSFQ